MQKNVANKKIQTFLDKRQYFEGYIQDFKNSLNQNKEVIIDHEAKAVEGRDINVCIRARPLLEFELAAEYFDITHANQPNFYFFEPKISLKLEPIIDLQEFKIDYAFGPQDEN